MPARFFVLHHAQRSKPTADAGEAASPEDWQGVTFTCHNRLTVSRTGGDHPVMKQGKTRIPPHFPQ
jgi:hypothetical protein